MDRPANGLPEDLREHTRADVRHHRHRVPDRQDARGHADSWRATFRRCTIRSWKSAKDTTPRRTTIISDGYERIARFHLSQLAYLATKLDSMPEGDGTVLDNSCLMFLSNMWIGRKHDNTRLPLVLAGGLGRHAQTGRTLNYLKAGDDNRKMCSLYLSIMDRMGVKLDRFGDAETRLEGL